MLLLCCSCGMALGQNETDLRRAAAKDGEGYMPVLVDDTITYNIAFRPTLYVKDYDPYYLGAESVPIWSNTSDTVFFNGKKYRAFTGWLLTNLLFIREDTLAGQVFRYYPELDTEVMTCDMSLLEGDTFYLPSIQNTWYWELSGQGFVVVDSVTYSNGRKVIWFPLDVDGSFFGTGYREYPLCFIEGVGSIYGPFGYVEISLENWLNMLLCVHHNDSLVYMTDPVLGCEQYVVSVPEYPDVSMKLYPNPATNTLHVEFEGTDDPQGTITVTNITGVVVLTRECHEPVTQLDVSNLSPGLYVVSFRNEKGVVVRKFVKM